MRSGPYAGGPGGRGAAGALLIPASDGKAKQQLRRDAESPARPGARPRRGGDGRPRPGRETGGGTTHTNRGRGPGAFKHPEEPRGGASARDSPGNGPAGSPSPGQAPHPAPAPSAPGPERRPKRGAAAAPEEVFLSSYSFFIFQILPPRRCPPPPPPRTRKTDVNESADGGSGRGGCCGLRGGLSPRPAPRRARPRLAAVRVTLGHAQGN